MLDPWWVFAAVAAAAAAVLAFVWRPFRTASRDARFAQRRKDFHTQRERLEAKFVQLAPANSAANGPHWEDCDFDDDVAYVRNRRTGELLAFVAVTVAVDGFGNIPPGTGEMIGNLRAGTAVFRFAGDHWETDGRAFLNLSPAEAISVYRKELEVVEQELAQRD